MDFKYKKSTGLVKGTILGMGAGFSINILSWLFAGTLKVLLTYPSFIWPDGFPGYIPDFFFSTMWITVVVVSTALGGGIIGYHFPNRLEIL